MILKNSVLLLGLMVCFSCKNTNQEPERIQIPSGTTTPETQNKTADPIALGKTLWMGKGNCFSCHKTNETSIGPSIVSIQKIYEEKNGDIVRFLQQKAEPIVQPELYSVMKTNFAILQTFTPKELQALEAYMKQEAQKSVN